MSHIIQAAGVSGLGLAITSCSYIMKHLHLQPLLNYHFHSASIIPLTESPSQFFLRAALDFNMREVVIFDSKGVKLYSIERGLVFNPLWTMYSYPDRHPVATIVVALTFASVDFLNRVDYCHRRVLLDIGYSGAYKSFYLPDGAKYSWTTGLRCLEKVQSPHCGTEEVRVRVAKAKLMRQFRLDYEVLIDENLIGKEIALATSFISMLTQWGVGNAVAGVGPTYIGPKEKDEIEKPKEKEEAFNSSEPSTGSLVRSGDAVAAFGDGIAPCALTQCADEPPSANSSDLLPASTENPLFLASL